MRGGRRGCRGARSTSIRLGAGNAGYRSLGQLSHLGVSPAYNHGLASRHTMG